MNTKKQELDILVEKGIITSDEREKLLAGEFAKQVPEQVMTSKSLTNSNSADAVQKIITLGSVLVGIGIILFVSTNWEFIPDALKNIMLILFVVISYGVGWYLRDVKNLFRTGEALMLLGGISSVAVLALISQSYHVVSDTYGTLLLMWAICLVFPTYIFVSRPLSVLFAGVVGVTLQVNIFEHMNYFQSYSWVNAVSLISLLTSLIFFTVGGLHYISNKYLIIGKYYRHIAVTAATVSLFTLTDYNKYSSSFMDLNNVKESIPANFVMIIGLLAFLSVCLCLVSIAINVPKDMVRKQAHVFPILLSVFVPISLLLSTSPSGELIASLVYNIIYITGVFYIIYFGTVYGYKDFINFGLLAFSIYFFFRVFSWLWQLEGSIFLIVTGIVLIAFGFVFEKARVNLLNSIPKQNN
jgi:uncharacterized membrane protein